MKALLAMAAMAAVLALPGALADDISTGAVTDPFGPMVPAEAGPIPVFYVHDDGSVWQESNGCAGLQTSGGATEACGEYAQDEMLNGAIEAPEFPSLPPL